MDYLDLFLKIFLGILALFGIKDVAYKISIKLNKKIETSNYHNSSSENIGGNKFVNITTNYNIQTVGSRESLLALSTIGSGSEKENEDDFRIVALSKLQNVENSAITSLLDIDQIQRFFQRVFDEEGSSRNAKSLMSGAFFAVASEEKNLEWQEHCASSLREFLHEWKGSPGLISNAFNKAKGQSLNFPSMKKNSGFYYRMAVYYDYFSGKCHHNHSEVSRKLRFIHTNETIKQDDSNLFKKTVSMFLFELFEIIKETKI